MTGDTRGSKVHTRPRSSPFLFIFIDLRPPRAGLPEVRVGDPARNWRGPYFWDRNCAVSTSTCKCAKMKFDQLRSIGHNIADSLASGDSLLFGFFEGPKLSVFGAALHSPERRVVVDFLIGQATQGEVSPRLARTIADSPDALAFLCKKHCTSPTMFRELSASYSAGGPGQYSFTVAIEDNSGRRALDEYVGIPGKRILSRDHLGRLRRKRGYVSDQGR